MGNKETFFGQNPEMQDYVKAIADAIADNVSVVVKRADVTAAATSSAWSYSVPFELQSSADGSVLPINGPIAATVADTSTAGTASVSSATPAVVMGRGTVTLSGDAQAWLAAETATLTLTYTKLRSGTVTDTFVVTFA